MNIPHRISLLLKLGEYMVENAPGWKEAKHRASIENAWFVPEFIEVAVQQICNHFLQKSALDAMVAKYHLPNTQANPKTVGIVMAGNIPLVGFHDFLCGFLSGHRLLIKPSSKDNALLHHLIEQLKQWEPETANWIEETDRLKGADAYIATGSNNTGRYFDYYFAKYPNIIRRNRTSAAVLTGRETTEELALLADDMMLYFGLGCRNVSMLMVPPGYNFEPLLAQLDRYSWMNSHFKYKNNYDYQLSLLLLNQTPHITNGTVLLCRHVQLFSPISLYHYTYYEPQDDLNQLLPANNLQCLVGRQFTPFGQAQSPGIADFADGVDTMAFFAGL